MNAEQRMVTEFHERFGIARNERPQWPGEDLHRIRVALIEEELAEFRNAGDAESLVEVSDALADLLYVVYGTAVTYGIDLEPIFREIHRSNMTKSGECERSRWDGKVSKGSSYEPPQIEPILREQTGGLAAVGSGEAVS
ncbi:MAG TPA: nucleotide pyrophosphohydrolase [Candidatus Dormibacteraeota bacterium]|jgi:predicted HAD superfamily Cof-like phosphohydrolase|nr:nucleotide pyrophosphohydrolase [Candidatus Dormibacteraeota bacterium]